MIDTTGGRHGWRRVTLVQRGCPWPEQSRRLHSPRRAAATASATIAEVASNRSDDVFSSVGCRNAVEKQGVGEETQASDDDQCDTAGQRDLRQVPLTDGLAVIARQAGRAPDGINDPAPGAGHERRIRWVDFALQAANAMAECLDAAGHPVPWQRR